jgi:hypothetical protein
MSEAGHSRPGRASRKSGHVRYDPKAEVAPEHSRRRDGSLRVDGAAPTVRIWGTHRAHLCSEFAETAPHPNPLPAKSGAREK